MPHGQKKKKKKGKEKQNQGHISATSALTSPQLHLLTFTPETFTPQGLYNWAAVSGISLQQCWLEKEQRSCTEDEVLGCLELWCYNSSIALSHKLLTFLFFCRFQHGLACFPSTVTILSSKQSLSLLQTTEGQNDVREWAWKFHLSNRALVFMVISPHPEATKSSLIRTKDALILKGFRSCVPVTKDKRQAYICHTQLQHTRTTASPIPWPTFP